jgi:hypothetical protein
MLFEGGCLGEAVCMAHHHGQPVKNKNGSLRKIDTDGHSRESQVSD